MLNRRASDAELLAASRRQRRAFAAFYDRYERTIAGYFMRRTRDPELSADLTAEVFAAAYAAAERFTGEHAAGWLFTIAHNTLVSSLRRGRVESEARFALGIDEAIRIHSGTVRRLEALVVGEAWVRELLDRLPADQREAVRARVLEDQDYEEIATSLGTSPLVVRKRVSRGLATLRRELQKEET